ncbi:MAG: CPXCG motif-containing cysteine-rich protein [Steroidobacterales bacterium]
MNPRRIRSRATSQPPLDQKAIDQRYGLEPVFEPAHSLPAGTAGGARFATVQCPYCGQPFDTLVDLSAGSTSYIEDCQICCQPIELGIEIGVSGGLRSITARRSD